MRRAHRVLVPALAVSICGTFGTAVATVTTGSVQPAAAPAPAVPTVARGLATLAAVPAAPADRLFAVARLEGMAAAAVGALEGLGLQALPLRNLPLALVAGTKDQLTSAVKGGAALDVYPNEQLRFFSAESTAAIKADVTRAAGFTGDGVGVAIVDSGIDATHPDLADHVTHNFKMIGPEYLDLLGGKAQPDGTIALPMHDLPYNNSDTTSGHGTHVAGIVAADATTGPSQVGVAPDANLIGYGTGDLISIFTVLAAFDDILAHHGEWGIRVVNNSWGTSPRPFDANHPVNLATRALHDAGLVVVFAAGNDGHEGTMNPYSVAPWVISAGSATLTKEKSTFSSMGFEFDNSLPDPLPADRHLRFEGDRIGIYHPDVSAPGTDIVSSGTPTGIGVLSPTLPGGTATLSGTSMAAPHVAGLAAVLLEANPALTPDQVRQVLQVTTDPMAAATPFWQSGYGFVNAEAAVALVRRADFSQALLDQLQGAADTEVLSARAHKVRAVDQWSFLAPLLSVAGSVSHVFETSVAPETETVRAIVTYPTLSLVGVNPFDWELTLTDAAGKVVGTTTPSGEAGTSTLTVDLSAIQGLSFGTWKASLSGVLGVADTDILLGNIVTVTLAQVEPQAAPAQTPTFEQTGSHTLFFQGPTAEPVLPVPLPTLGGCTLTAGAPQGTMGGAQVTDSCTAGLVGFALNYGAGRPAHFTASGPLAAPAVLGGESSFTLWLADPAAPVWTEVASSAVAYTLNAVTSTGEVVAVASGELSRKVDSADEVGLEPTRAEYAFEVPPTTVPAGATLVLDLRFSGAYTSGMQLFYGGPYADAGVTLGAGQLTG
ncbi:MAG: S8 family serine peptidase [Acidimicrobiales bacterium]